MGRLKRKILEAQRMMLLNGRKREREREREKERERGLFKNDEICSPKEKKYGL